MVKIFISYRRADSQFVADIIYDYMQRHFGKERVFIDVGSIPFGVDFREYLDEQITAHDVVLVIMGPDWARIMQERADQQNDFVRIEIESALRQKKLVIPVLVKNATMPNFTDLPTSIQELQWRNSATVRRQPDLENDCTRLADGIRQYFENKPAQKQQATPPPAEPIAVPPKQEATAKPTSLDLLPQPFDWIEIPGGNGTLQTDNKNVTLAIPTETYWIAKYPVTNAQFDGFINARDGYSNAKWWAYSQTAQAWREENTTPQATAFAGDTLPRTNVAWYEAIAFCLWLSEQAGEKIMLPTEAQWQYAAQGDDGRTYPWGDEWDKSRCQNSVGGNRGSAGTTTPVTQYEGKGNSPFGVVDMAGNVWEWCLTEHDSGNNKLSGSSVRVVRGGSWFDYNSDYFHCAFRDDRYPHNWFSGLGFRIARS